MAVLGKSFISITAPFRYCYWRKPVFFPSSLPSPSILVISHINLLSWRQLSFFSGCHLFWKPRFLFLKYCGLSWIVLQQILSQFGAIQFLDDIIPFECEHRNSDLLWDWHSCMLPTVRRTRLCPNRRRCEVWQSTLCLRRPVNHPCPRILSMPVDRTTVGLGLPLFLAGSNHGCNDPKLAHSYCYWRRCFSRALEVLHMGRYGCHGFDRSS